MEFYDFFSRLLQVEKPANVFRRGHRVSENVLVDDVVEGIDDALEGIDDAVEGIHTELEVLFHEYIHTTDSKTVKNEIDKVSRKHGNSSILQKNVHQATYYLKCLARKHGLPISACPILCSLLKSRDGSVSQRTKFQLAQALNHSVTNDKEFITFSDCLQVLEVIGESAIESLQQKQEIVYQNQEYVEERNNHFLQETASEIVSCFIKQISSDNYDSSVALRLQKIIPSLKLQNGADVLKKLENWQINADNPCISSVLDEDDDSFIRKDGKRVDAHAAFSLGSDIFRKRQLGLKGNVKADAVKTQQAIAVTNKSCSSERTEIRKLNLANALKSAKSKSAQFNTELSVEPGVKGEKGSDRACWRTSGKEIENFAQMAKSRSPIKDEDIEWLKEKTCFGFRVTNMLIGVTEMISIMNIFLMVIKYQDIPSNILDSLGKNLFSRSLSRDYETCRVKLLETLEFNSRRKIQNSTRLTEILTKFKESNSGCTTEMRKLIWKIFWKDDKNIESKFPEAVNELMAIKSPNDSDHFEAIAYIGMQVVVEQQCISLENRHHFFEKLLNIVENKGCVYIPAIRVHVAEVVEDYLSHDLTVAGLHLKILDRLFISYNDCIKQNHYHSVEDPTLWQSPDWIKFQKHLISSIMRTLVKTRGATPSNEVLNLLVDLSVREEDRKFEALIVTYLGNLVDRSPPVAIPNCEKLAYKLSKTDAVDEDAHVYLDGSEGNAGEDFAELRKNGLELTNISAIVAKILQTYCLHRDSGSKNKSSQFFQEATITELVKAVASSPDKMTRILCSECLYHAATSTQQQSFNELFFSTLQPCTLSEVLDIQVYSTAAYCSALERFICKGPSFQILSYEHMSWLPKLYAFEKLAIDSKEFSEFVNPPIIHILENQKQAVKFPEQILQMLTLILSNFEGENSKVLKHVLKIIHKQIEREESSHEPEPLPSYCAKAVENIFLNEPTMLTASGKLLISSSMILGQIMSDSVVEEWRKIIEFESPLNSFKKYKMSLTGLIVSNINQNVSAHVFQELDLELIGWKLASLLQTLNPELNLKTLIESLKLGHLQKYLYGTERNRTATLHDLGSVISALDCILFYVRNGKKLSPLLCYILEKILLFPEFQERAIDCLTFAAENGQSLTTGIVNNVFETNSKDFGTALNGKLSLASALVLNNQTLPDSCIEQLVTNFCEQDISKMFDGNDANCKQLLLLMSHLAQRSDKCLPRKLDIVRTLVKWWEMSKDYSNSHRFDILSTLLGLIKQRGLLIELNEEIKLIKEVLLDAVRDDDDAQIQEIGLQGCLLINNDINAAKLWSGSDLEEIAVIQLKLTIKTKSKEIIAKLLCGQRHRLPALVSFEMSLNEVMLEENDSSFLEKIHSLLMNNLDAQLDEKIKKRQLSWQQLTSLLNNTKCHKRLESILYRIQDNSLIVQQALQVLSKFVAIFQAAFPISTLEAVAFTMANNHESEKVREPCRDILKQVLDQDIEFSETLKAYLEMGSSYCSDILLKIMPTNSLQISTETQQCLLKGEDLNIHDLGTLFGENHDHIALNENGLKELLKVDNEVLQKDFSNEVELISASLLHISSSKISTDVYIAAAQMVENAIISSSGTSLSYTVLAAYKRIVEDDFATCLDFAVECMTRSFDHPNCKHYEIQLIILECIVEASRRLEILPPKMHKFLIDQLQSSVAIFRQLSFDALWCDKEFSADFSATFQLVITDMHKQIYGAEKKDFDIRTEADKFMKDQALAHQFLKFLFSLTYWDFKSLRSVKNEQFKWKRFLLISDTVACFAKTEDEKLEMALNLLKMFERMVEQDAIELISMLTRRCKEDQYLSIVQAVRAVSKMSFENAIKCMKVPKGNYRGSNFISLLFDAALAETLTDKFSFKIFYNILVIFAKKLTASIGYEMAQNLVNALSAGSIINMEEFEDLICILTNLDNKDKLSSLKFPKGTTLSIAKLKVLLETFALLESLPEGMKRKSRFERHFTALLSKGVRAAQIKELQEVIWKNIKATSGSSVKIFQIYFEHLISQSYQYNVGHILFDRIISLFEECGLDQTLLQDTIQKCNKLLNSETFSGTAGDVKDVKSIVEEFNSKNPNTLLKFEIDVIIKYIMRINICNESSSFWNPSRDCRSNISEWNEEDIKCWAKEVKTCSKTNSKSVKPWISDFYIEALMIAKQAFFLTTSFHMTNVQILSCLLGLKKYHNDTVNDHRQGQLQQVVTGSGKSAIIAVLAVIKCLEGSTVDVFTSSTVLAERDAKQWSKFYELFGVTCDHNGDKQSGYISGKKPCYQNEIVYGDCAQFQFDYLRDTYSALGTLAGRKQEFAIVDEVDSMFIDDGSKLARLSSNLPGMDLLQIIYHLLFDRLTYLKTHLFSISQQVYYLEGMPKMETNGIVSYSFADQKSNDLMTIPDVFTYIVSGQNLDLARIHPVENVETFVSSHLNTYIQALILEEKIPGYSFDNSKDSNMEKKLKIKLPQNLKEFAKTQIPKWVESALTAIAFEENRNYILDDGQVKPVDFQTTGVVQSSTNWNNGLHQCLQIKHFCKVTSETITTNFLSNLAMFRKYGHNLLGLTGTLGLKAGKEVLSQLYNVTLLKLPRVHSKRYFRFPDVLAQNEADWLREIVIVTLEESYKSRGVLIICETIQEAEMIDKALAFFKKVKVKLYTKNQQGQERQIERIHPGDVIVATNLAGRGTDIRAKDIEKFGGLHVCLTFLPDSLRVEKQAFGRTSRQGNMGTGQLIVKAEAGLSSSTQLILQRNENEQERLKKFQLTIRKIIDMKDQLFDKFSKFIQTIRRDLRNKRSIIGKINANALVKKCFGSDYGPPLSEVIILQAIEERWAMFLRDVDDGRVGLDVALGEYNKFEESAKKDYDNGNIIQSSKNLFYFIQLGNQEYFEDSKYSNKLEKSKKHFENAIGLDADFAAAASVGKANVLLKGQVNLARKNRHDDDYKDKALHLLQSALRLLHDEMALLIVMQSLVVKRDRARMESELFEQLTEKSNLLGHYIKNVEAAISTTKKSLRRVYCIGIDANGKRQESLLLEDKSMQTNREIPLKNFSKYELAFNDLTYYKDSGITKDQAIETIQGSSDLTGISIGLSCPDADLGVILANKNIIKQTFTLDFEICGLENSDTGELPFDLDSLSDSCASYSLEVLDKPSTLAKITMNSALESTDFKIESHFFNDPDNPHKKLVENFDQDEQCRRNQTSIFHDGECRTLKFVQLKSVADVKTILKVVKEADGSTPKVNLTFTILKKATTASVLKEIWDKVWAQFSNNCVHFTGMNQSGANKIIECLRQLNINFTLHFCDLSLTQAKKVLKKADIVQENIEQSKISELTQLFMTDRLPLLELQELKARGITHLVCFNEKQFVPWISVASVCGLAAFQAAAGGLLICTGFGATLGLGLITEGMADMVIAQQIYSTRQFNWSQYRLQKAVSLAISAYSMGLSGLKDGAKGVAKLVQGVATEAVEQAGTKLVVSGGKMVNVAINVTGKNLKVLAVQKLGIAAAETGGRICLKNVLTNFCFDQLRGRISDEVGNGVNANFRTSRFIRALSYHCALKSHCISKNTAETVPMKMARAMSQLMLMVQSIVTNTMEPMSSWCEKWTSVIGPLCSTIFSKVSKDLSSTFSMMAKACSCISDMHSIIKIADIVCLDIIQKLEQQKLPLAQLLQNHCDLSKEKAEKLAGQIKLQNDKGQGEKDFALEDLQE